MQSKRAIAIVAGEPSGDRHAANVVRAFGGICPEAAWFGAGGPDLRAAGAEILVPMERLAVVGIGEVLAHLPDLFGAMKTLRRALEERRPDALVLVDFPDFNFRLARHASKLQIPILYYITPQVWAWRQSRTAFLRDRISRALVIFPFEETFMRERGVDAEFVGHPLVEDLPQACSRDAFCERNALDPAGLLVGLLPGSRNSEVRRILPPLAGAAGLLSKERSDLTFLLPWAANLKPSLRDLAGSHPVRFVEGQYHDLLGNVDAAAVASGTATLESALLGVPMVAVYRLNPVTYAIGKRLVHLPRVALPNVVLESSEVPELIQGDCTPRSIAAALRPLLADPAAARAESADLASNLREKLGGGSASHKAAERICAFLESRADHRHSIE